MDININKPFQYGIYVYQPISANVEEGCFCFFFPLCSFSVLVSEIIFSSPSRSPLFCVLHADVRSLFTLCLLANV